MNYTQDLNDTIVALATPSGVGAIGVIRLSGKAAITICNKVFKGKNLTKVPSHTIHFGTIRHEKGHILDEVLVALFVAPKSYTRENIVEVSCHGSPYIQQQIIQLFIRLGARMAKPGEFTLRAFLNGQLDLSQAEAVADLIAATSASSHTVALQQMRGGFSSEIKKLRQELIHFASLIELELDFSEEDVEFANREELRALIQKIQRLIKHLMNSFRLGNAIKNGVNTVIAGRPNAGKSTLLNALLNEERAIVSEIAGTTRDTIEEILNIKGIQFRLIDTAGIRDATDQIEAIGVKKTLEQIQRSAILVYVFDRLTQTSDNVANDLKKLAKKGLQILLIGNKSDAFEQLYNEGQINTLQKDSQTVTWAELQKKYTFIHISAKEKTQLEELKQALYETVTTKNFTLESTIVSNVRHYEALQKSTQSLTDVLNGMEMGVTGDFLAQDIRYALAYLGEITGEVSTDDILGNIFSNFCIGK